MSGEDRIPFDRARFDESIELARTQLAFPPPDPETGPDLQTGRDADRDAEDEERER